MVAQSPYDSVNSILNAARFTLNDVLKTLQPVSGQILEETLASTQQAFNNASRRFQDALGDAGVDRFKGEKVIIGIPPTTNLDPASKQSISWFQFFDGTNYLQNGPLLPAELILPLWMSERPSVTGGQNIFPFPDVNRPNMRLMVDGLQSRIKYQFNGQWEWREDRIFFPGAINPVDFRIGFRSYLPDVIDVGITRWFEQPYQIMRCQDQMRWWLAAEFCAARAADGDATEQMLAVAQSCTEQAMESTKLWINQGVMKNERTNVRRQPYPSGRRNGGWGGGFGNYGAW